MSGAKGRRDGSDEEGRGWGGVCSSAPVSLTVIPVRECHC